MYKFILGDFCTVRFLSCPFGKIIFRPLRAMTEIKYYIYLVIFLYFGQPPAPPRKRGSHTIGKYLFTCFLLNKGGIDEEPNVPYVTANCGRKDAQLIMTDLYSAGYCFNSTSSVVQCACQSL